MSSPKLRWAERIALGFFAYALVVSWFFSLSSGQRMAVAALNGMAAGVVVLLGRDTRPSNILAPLRDWLPCVLIVLAYRESGMFLTPDVTHHLDNLFIGWDRILLESAWFRCLVDFGSFWLDHFMELAYLLVYPFVPLGFAAVYFGASRAGDSAGEKRPGVDTSADRYWTAVLLAVLTSYALFPYFPLTPPRVMFHDMPESSGLAAATNLAAPAAQSLIRKLNLWVLDRYSVQACIFPSGHVAGAVATALAVRAERPRLGWLFIFAAASIAVSTVFGRYHYIADALAGALIGVMAYGVAAWIHKRPPAAKGSEV